MTLPALTDEQRERAVTLARQGMSIQGIANAIGIKRTTLNDKMRKDPPFEAKVLAALAEYEYELVDRMNQLAADPSTIMQAKTVQDILARRFPQRHGSDPRLRLQFDQVQDRHVQESDDAPDAVKPGLLDEAINQLLDRREAGKD